MNKPFDVVIAGAGLGGLLCAVILAKNGKKVAVIEQNKQIGGCLQTFSFAKKAFDSCVHYIGALDEGQTQRRIFDYVGITSALPFKKLDIDCFDQIIVGDNPTNFAHAQGFENFKDRLCQHFPKATQELENYIGLLKKVGDSFPLFKLRMGSASEKLAVSSLELNSTLEQTISDPLLRQIICGNSLLYAGDSHATPFYVHALVLQSYIESAWKCDGASSLISKELGKQLRNYGGEMIRNEKITALNGKNGWLTHASTHTGRMVEGKQFIAAAHPATVVGWLDPSMIKNAYRRRIQSAPSSVSAFMINAVLQPGKVPYTNSNIYWNAGNPLDAIQESIERFSNYALYFTEDKAHPGYADTLAILAYMHPSATAKWHHTQNRSAAPEDRGEEYEDFKALTAQLLLTLVSQRFPEVIRHITQYKSATPLTFRDYMGSPDGSMYGILTDVHNPDITRVPIRTKIPNLLLTGQNINLHGVLGVSVTAVATCAEMLGMEYILQQINKE
jgi:all-trans-retinol 13,14-reductase